MNHVVVLVINSKVLGAYEPLSQEHEDTEISVLYSWIVLRVQLFLVPYDTEKPMCNIVL